MSRRPAIIRPGNFGASAAADGRRPEFDYHNEILVAHGVAVDFVFIGDSITHLWELDTYFGRNGSMIVNRGISGDITSHVLKRFEADVVQLRPKRAVICIGINNTWAMEAWLPQERRQEAEIKREVLEDIGAMARLAEEHAIVPIVCSLLPTAIAINVHTQRRNRLVIDINAELRRMCEANGRIYVDYHERLVAPDGETLRPELADDGLHPHVLGYDIMADALKKELARHGIAFAGDRMRETAEIE